MNRVSLVLVLHAHQPIGNFDSVLELNYRLAYLPFIECLERHPAVSLNLHYSGVLLEWLAVHHPEYLERLRALREAGSVEFWGGGFYEPVLISIPEQDRQAQIAQMQEHLEERLGERPRGLWLTERVWEPTLPETLARAGVEYTLVDDLHFLSAGVEPDALYGCYQTESMGKWVRVIPGLKSLRYALPWKPVGETIGMLQRIAEAHPDSLVAMGDDLEKFGGWPQTHHSVYEERWLEEFFSALEANRSWLDCPRASDYLESHEAAGTVYLPTASYREMTEWTLGGRAAELYQEALGRVRSLERGDEFLRFLSGGTWRNFFAKYSESNLLHKQMLALSERFEQAKPKPSAAASWRAWQAAYRHLLAAQCNDAYWHGVFGGLYAPHLRHGVYSHLVQAEAELEKLAKVYRKRRALAEPCDWLGTGREALEIRTAEVSCLIQPFDGATVAAIRSKRAAANLVNSLRRRPELYHAKVRAGAQSAGGVESIHERVSNKEAGLERFLRYDRYDRHAFRVYFFQAAKGWEDFAALRLEEFDGWAAGRYLAGEPKDDGGVFTRTGPLAMGESNLEISLQKEFTVAEEGAGTRLCCALKLDCMQGGGSLRLGLEMILNLLAGHAPDRYYHAADWREALDWEGERILPGALGLRDDWLRLDLELAAHPTPSRWWFAPIFTVSQSEEGFERVYQGSAILPVWELELKTADSWEGSLALTIRGIR